MALFDFMRRKRSEPEPAPTPAPLAAALAAAVEDPAVARGPDAAVQDVAVQPEPAVAAPPAEADPAQEAADTDLLRSAFDEAESQVSPLDTLAAGLDDVDSVSLLNQAHAVLSMVRT